MKNKHNKKSFEPKDGFKSKKIEKAPKIEKQKYKPKFIGKDTAENSLK